MIITTYRMNKRGFDCALSRATSRAVFWPIFYFSISFLSPLFLLHITQVSFTFFVFFYLVPHQVSNHLPFAYISLTSLSSTPLYHEIQLRFIPPKLIFILIDSLACPKISISIYLFICLTPAACCMLHACTKTSIAFVSPWRIKSELFLEIRFDQLYKSMSSINSFKFCNILADHDQ